MQLAISPCPNDTFAFYALLHGKTSWGEAPICLFEDIEALNHRALEGEADICKVSFHAYLLLRDRYRLLESGSALGHGCGPLVVTKPGRGESAVHKGKVAIPGRLTTAALLLELCYGKDLDLVAMTFDDIMPAVAVGTVDAGLIIHESRFTFGQHGLEQLIDLGAWWEETTGTAIPLGGIVAKRTLDENQIKAFDRALGESIAYAWQHEAEVTPFMQKHAQEMEPHVMQQHVGLYVNDYTRALGSAGHAAIDRLEQAYDAL
jgi:1,4-dihydroxy-6-naphthoate synthase